MPKMKIAQVQLGVGANKVNRIEVNVPQPMPRTGVSQKVIFYRARFELIFEFRKTSTYKLASASDHYQAVNLRAVQ